MHPLKRVIWSTGVLIVVDKLVCRGSSTKRFHSYWAINGVEGELRACLLTIFYFYFLFSENSFLFFRLENLFGNPKLIEKKNFLKSQFVKEIENN